jgi:hypothetical protein
VIQVDDRDGSALLREADRPRATHAGPGSRYDTNFVRQTHDRFL